MLERYFQVAFLQKHLLPRGHSSVKAKLQEYSLSYVSCSCLHVGELETIKHFLFLKVFPFFAGGRRGADCKNKCLLAPVHLGNVGLE